MVREVYVRLRILCSALYVEPFMYSMPFFLDTLETQSDRFFLLRNNSIYVTQECISVGANCARKLIIKSVSEAAECKMFIWYKADDSISNHST